MRSYLFTDRQESLFSGDILSLFGYSKSGVVKFKDVENIESKKADIFDVVKDQKISNFYFSFDNDPQVFVCSHDSASIQPAGFLIDPSWVSPEVKLYHQSVIDVYSDSMLIYDGREIFSSLVPEDLRRYVHTSAEVENNPVPPSNSMESSVGRVTVSSCNAGGLPQHAFLSFPTSSKNLHMKEQWLSSSKDCDEEQFIGYEFHDSIYRLKSVQMICRLGSHTKPALMPPTPKIIIVEGRDPETNQWEDITNPIVLKKNAWKHFTPIEIELHDDDEDIKHYSGFRIKITKWFAGNEPDMLTGMMRVKFLCTNSNKVTLPIYPTPSEHLVYAQFNPLLLDTYPKTVYPVKDRDPKIKDVQIPETTPPVSDAVIAPTTSSSDSLISTLSITDEVGINHYASPVSAINVDSTIQFHENVMNVEWMTTNIPMIFRMEDEKNGSKTTMYINASGLNIEVSGDRDFFVVNDLSTISGGFEMEPGDRMIVRALGDRWFVYYIEK